MSALSATSAVDPSVNMPLSLSLSINSHQYLSELPVAPEHKTNRQQSASEPFCTFPIVDQGGVKMCPNQTPY